VNFHDVVKSITDYAIFLLDAQGVVTSWNHGAQQLKGYKPGEIIGKHFSVFYPKKDAQAGKPERHLKIAKREGRTEDAGWRRRKDGQLFWANVTITAIRNECGKLEGFVKVTRDDTKRKQIEDALRQSQAELAEGQRIAHLGSWNWNILTNKLTWTDEIYRLYGLKRTAKPPTYAMFQKMLHPDDRVRIEKAIGDSLKHDHPYHVEFRIVKRDGEVRHVFGRGEVFRDARGKPLRMTGSVIDVTEVRRSQAALHVSEEQFSSAFGNATIGMAIVAPDGKWIKVNRALCELTGYPERELTQKTFQDITHPDDLENDLKNARRLLAGKIKSYHIEKRYFHKRGHIVWVLLGVTLVRDADGKPLHFVSQIQDITQRKQSDAKLHTAMERMQLAARAA
jgi:PAS domain S-box-containing protein